MKGFTPCYKTIAHFREENTVAFRESFRQFTCFLRTEGLFCEDRVATEVPSLARVKLEKALYRRRQEIVEHPFGTIKRQWGYDYTLMKGLGNRGWQISASVSGTIGLQYSKNVENYANEASFNRSLKGIARGFIGYHGHLWVFGISGFADIQGLNTKYVQYRTNNLNATLFCIYKIKSKWMQGRKSLFQKNKKMG